MTSAGAGHTSRAQARAAKARAAEQLAALPGVVGIGLERQGDGGWCVRVNVTSQEVAQAVGARLPEESQAVPVLVRVTGSVQAAGHQQER